MRPRSVAEFVSDLRYARRAAHQYRLEARRLRALAAEEDAAGHLLTARRLRYKALLAEHAAEAETAAQDTLP